MRGQTNGFWNYHGASSLNITAAYYDTGYRRKAFYVPGVSGLKGNLRDENMNMAAGWGLELREKGERKAGVRHELPELLAEPSRGQTNGRRNYSHERYPDRSTLHARAG